MLQINNRESVFALFIFYYFFVFLFCNEVCWCFLADNFEYPRRVCFIINQRWIFNDWLIECYELALRRSVNLCSCLNTLNGDYACPFFKTFAHSRMLDMDNFAKLALGMISNSDSVSIAF